MIIYIYIYIIVVDNGQGLPEDFKLTEQTSLGFKLIQTLSSQLDGDISLLERIWSDDDKTEASIQPLRKLTPVIAKALRLLQLLPNGYAGELYGMFLEIRNRFI